MTEQKQPNKENWDDFAGEWLKAEMIKVYPTALVCIDVEAYFDDDDKAHLILTFNFMNKKKKFEVNKTNQDVLKDFGITSPKSLDHKKITFVTHKVRNPNTKKMVNSLLIDKVE